MTDQATAAAPVARGGTLGLRLALAFVAVALAAVALLAGLTAAFAVGGRLVAGQPAACRPDRRRSRWPRGRPGTGTTAGPGPTCPRCWTWPRVPARTSRSATRAGRAVATSPGFAAQTGPQASAPVVVHGPAGRARSRSGSPARAWAPPTAYCGGAAAGHRRGGRAGGAAGAAHRPGGGPADHPAGGPADRGDPRHGRR